MMDTARLTDMEITFNEHKNPANLIQKQHPSSKAVQEGARYLQGQGSHLDSDNLNYVGIFFIYLKLEEHNNDMKNYLPRKLFTKKQQIFARMLNLHAKSLKRYLYIFAK